MAVESRKSRRRYLLALMYIQGMSLEEMAQRTEYSVSSVRHICEGDLFQALVAQLRRELNERTVGTILSRIEKEALPSFDRLMAIRDGDVVDPAIGRLQLDAAKFHLGELYMDRAHPKVTRQQTENVTRITFDKDAMGQMMNALAEERGEIIEVKAIDSPTIAIEDGAVGRGGAVPSPRIERLEDVARELRAEEAQA